MKRKVTPTQHPSPKRKPRTRKTKTLMKVSSGDGMQNWVTVQLPAWVMLGTFALVLLVILACVFSPQFAANVSWAVVEWVRRFTTGASSSTQP